MSKITIKDLYLIFGNDKQHALRMLKEEKSKSEILKATGCTVRKRCKPIYPGRRNICDYGTFGKWKINFAALHQPIDKTDLGRSDH